MYNDQLKIITTTLDTLNKKDTLTNDEIKKINNSLVSALKVLKLQWLILIEILWIMKIYEVKLQNKIIQ